ncbi:hypothetical protein CkaCkLH20_11087 [Colletotrichum karsti]|uniref:Enoyl reductase (ER) domain-containing protein n=1 Tax=Colletotrichum karsti TaxID=1095194 RepID=A0A9P6LGB7_9PEZI|nr:uncharacterized protein CkaCkLH20_11087 [Colletotrichum karsti]KAF9871440.1 hypothetical protein CkaCkLH20_11087 [Colletotrichum karsti]
MKGVQILGDITSPKITTTTSLTRPVPKNAEILVRVYAAGVTGDEVLWPELYQTATRIPGHEISGVIAALGPDYDGSLEIGQDVFAFISADQGQGQAEYAICSSNEVAPKPKWISHQEASALPIPLLTVWEAMVDHSSLKPGMRVLITGASGAVGSIAVQLMTQVAGAHVIGLASPRNHGNLRELGAQETFDYNAEGWETSIDDVDVVFDTVGGEVLKKCWKTVKADSVIITVADPAPNWAFARCRPTESASHPGVRYVYFIVSPNSERLSRASQRIDDASAKPLVVTVFSVDEAAEAWEAARQRGRGKKVVISFES